MKFGRDRKTGKFYAAEYRPESKKVEVVDTDKSLDKLLIRHEVLEEEKEND